MEQFWGLWIQVWRILDYEQAPPMGLRIVITDYSNLQYVYLQMNRTNVA